MDMNLVKEQLKKEAESNPASNAVFHVFALRKRARNMITLTSLYNKMKKEGFKNYDKNQYIPLLKLLASTGLGTLETDSKGKIKRVKNIKVTLQTIGKVACGQETELKGFKERNKYVSMSPEPKKREEEAATIDKCGINLEWLVNGKVVLIPLPKDLTVQEIATIINTLKSA